MPRRNRQAAEGFGGTLDSSAMTRRPALPKTGEELSKNRQTPM
jgi:hypothetical protein